MSCVNNEDDIMLYYRRFLQMSTHLYNSKQLTDYQRNATASTLKIGTFSPAASIF